MATSSTPRASDPRPAATAPAGLSDVADALAARLCYLFTLDEADRALLARDIRQGVERRLQVRSGECGAAVELSDYVPPRSFWRLDERFAHRIEMLVRHERERGRLTGAEGEQLIALADQLHDLGKQRVGDVVQMSTDDLQRITDADAALIALLNRELARGGLRLGLKAVGWTPGPLPPWVHV